MVEDMHSEGSDDDSSSEVETPMKTTPPNQDSRFVPCTLWSSDLVWNTEMFTTWKSNSILSTLHTSLILPQSCYTIYIPFTSSLWVSPLQFKHGQWEWWQWGVPSSQPGSPLTSTQTERSKPQGKIGIALRWNFRLINRRSIFKIILCLSDVRKKEPRLLHPWEDAQEGIRQGRKGK